jgi:transposase
MVAALEIRTDLSAGELRALARREKDPRAASRMYAIAHALEGLSRAEAARLAGMERQALHDAVVRYNAEGPAGLHDRPKGRRRPVLDEAEGVALKRLVLAGPDLARHGRTEWTLPSLAEEIAHLWGKRLHPASLSRVLRRLGLSKQKTRPRHPQADAEAQEAFKKGVLPRP